MYVCSYVCLYVRMCVGLYGSRGSCVEASPGAAGPGGGGVGLHTAASEEHHL